MIPSSSRSSTPNPRSESVSRTRDGPASSSIRPRNRRLGTLEDQELSTTSATSTPSGSRAVSPIPAKHPSRSNTGTLGNGRTVGGRLAPDIVGRNGPQRRSTSPASGIWNTSWMSSTFQQVASSVLGSVAGDEDPNARYGTIWGTTKRTAPAKEWGPSQAAAKENKDGGIGTGSTSEREAAVRAKKMKRILEGKDEDHTAVDTSGNYKRRISSDEQRPGSAQGDGHALVYVHHIQPQDTFAGIVLRYNCPREVVRKSNGLWNDSLSSRKTLLLPVDACAVKGRPCEPPSAGFHGVDLLAPTPGIEETPPLSNGSTWPGSQTETSAERSEDGDLPSHVRWVLIGSSPSSKPIEIARMPRKSLSYFPPRRRNSQTTLSSVSTPRASLDMAGLSQTISQTSTDPIGSPSSTPSRRVSSLGLRPSNAIGSTGSIGSYFPPPAPSARPRRERRESVGEAADRLGWMKGPGGVGTLGKSVRMPGPAQDSFNNWTRKNLPGIAIDSLPSSSILGAEVAHFGFNEELAAIAEGTSNDGNGVPGAATSSGAGFENAAAAVEGFFRKLAIKGVPGTPSANGRTDNADLIELLDGTGSDEGGRSFELSRSRSPMPGGSLREDTEGVLRGRSAAGAKGGKALGVHFGMNCITAALFTKSNETDPILVTRVLGSPEYREYMMDTVSAIGKSIASLYVALAAITNAYLIFIDQQVSIGAISYPQHLNRSSLNALRDTVMDLEPTIFRPWQFKRFLTNARLAYDMDSCLGFGLSSTSCNMQYGDHEVIFINDEEQTLEPSLADVGEFGAYSSSEVRIDLDPSDDHLGGESEQTTLETSTMLPQVNATKSSSLFKTL
ncbi:Uncharacterized protein LOCC1_G003881 [Lachnellula occidentalis]|uniref:LysM domain-containing protein n=1 Tax=Lachnellula occidentalis TaxID=215460 RepID=A0A8H8RUG9_9HELO|nr:Uncharacterized protein LOCC1_G003881 [Lachnellula occidentalis]